MCLVVSRIPVDGPAPRAPPRSERACMRSQGRTSRRWGPGHRSLSAHRSGYLGVRRSMAAGRPEREAAEARKDAEGVREVGVAAAWPLSLLRPPRRPPRVETDDDDVLILAHFRVIYLVATKKARQSASRWKKTNRYMVQNNTRTASPLRKGTVLASCGIRSRNQNQYQK